MNCFTPLLRLLPARKAAVSTLTLAIFLSVSGILPALAGSGASALQIGFLENKGQLKNPEGLPVPQVLFKASAPGFDLYITRSGLSYVFSEREGGEEEEAAALSGQSGTDDLQKKNLLARILQKKEKAGRKITYLRADMELTGATIDPISVIREGQSAGSSDYYYPHCPNGITGVHTFEKVTVKNIYPGIDWVIYSKGAALKYDFIVHPGADPGLIRLRYKGFSSSVLHADGSVVLTTPMGTITEGALLVYQGAVLLAAKSWIEKKRISGSEVIDLRFDIPDFDPGKGLVIDPELKWATYYGAPSSFEGTFSLDADGKSVWATGYVNSTDFPTLPKVGAYYQPNTGGPNDLFILKFDSSGAREWSTYYGGAGNDFGMSIHSDGASVWVTGLSSSFNLPLQDAGNGAYYQDLPVGLAGNYTFILKFDVNGARQWATLYGGLNSNIGTGIRSDGTDVWVTGFTQSADFPLQDAGNGAYFQNTLGGSTDAFLLRFDKSGKREWATLYGGNNSEGNLFPINSTPVLSVDDSSVWVAGHTASTDFPLYNPGGTAFFSDSAQGQSELYILRFDKAGKRKWGTYFGGSANDLCYSIYSDGIHLWLTGGTASVDFPTLNPGNGAYFQSILGGNTAPYILKFDLNGNLVWSTYLGTSGTGYSICSDTKQVWLSGEMSTGFPVTDPLDCSPYYSVAPGGRDMGIMQLTAAGYPLYATFYGGPGNDWCTALDIEPVTGAVYLSGEWAGNSLTNPTVDAGNGAWYQPVLAGSDDLFFMKYRVCPCPLPLPVIQGPGKVCKGQMAIFTASGGTAYKWSTGATTSSITIPVDSTITLSVEVSNACGKRVISHKMEAIELPVARTISDTAICIGQSLNIGGVKVSGYTYTWTSMPPGFTSDKSNPTITPDTTRVYRLHVVNKEGCSDTASVLVEVLTMPEASFTYEFTDNGLVVNFSGSTENGINQWEWDFGDRSVPETGQSVMHSYVQEDLFEVTLIVHNACGTDTIRQVIEVKLDTSSGISGNEWLAGMQLYPNPFRDVCRLTFSSPVAGMLSYSITDISGKELVKRTGIAVKAGSNTIVIPENPASLPAKGTYLLMFRWNGQLKKWVIERQ